MDPKIGKPSRQIKISTGPYVRRRQHRKAQARIKHNDQTELEPGEPARLSPIPASKAVAPYSPRSETEDSHIHITVVTERTLTPVGPRFEWYPLAVRDEAFFHILMASTSSHAAYLQKVELPRNFYFYRGQAIQLLNQRIARGDCDEGTINTIYMSAAITLDSKPILAPTIDVTDLKTYFGLPSSATISHAKTFGTRLYNFTNSPLSNQAAKVMWGLRNISQLSEEIHAGKIRAEPNLAFEAQFTDRVEVLERLVHPLWHVENPGAEQHPVFRTLGWTCLIYIYTVLRELPKELGINPTLAGRIRGTLESCPELNVLLATFQDLLLWEMFICGRVADDRDRPFFASQATKILLIRRVEDANEILKAAEGFIWPERQVQPSSSSNSEDSLSGSESGAMDVGD
ncbi:hypothetical protein G7Y89_g10432 [Cudoniella acicularis]|uniref:Uncharacterized protein n=1 Tax=Cudoniella acicularis TaxID=354080 RepID=A0A8H4RCS3_9HELO|nr:hypothetical protein G7Y89_g10432 [Cudoniella acicularis]